MLSILGLAALVVPAVLLIILTDSKSNQPTVSGGERQIDPQTVEDAVKKAPVPPPVVIPSPSPTPIETVFPEPASPSSSVETEGGVLAP